MADSSFPAADLKPGQSFRTADVNARNHKAKRVTPYETIGKSPNRTLLEVETEGLSYFLIFELTTPLYHAK